jgi:hypothetical protein
LPRGSVKGIEDGFLEGCMAGLSPLADTGVWSPSE